MVARLGEGTTLDLTDPRLAAAAGTLAERGLVEDGRLAGRRHRGLRARARGTTGGALRELLEGWAPEQHDDVRAMLDRLARELVAEPPTAPLPV